MRSARLIPALVLLSACDGWPLHAHLPDPVDAIPAGDLPGDVPDVERIVGPEADADQPPGELAARLGLDQGVTISGVLDGSGWWDDAEPTPIVGDDCDSEGTRSPGGGDWTADVDVARVRLLEPGRLCVTVESAADADVGLDAIVARLDRCGVPVGFVGDEEPLGFGGRAPQVRWSRVVDAGAHSLVVGAYLPDAPEETIPWRAQVDLVDEGAFCPPLAEVP